MNMDWMESLILGVVQGLTEFLPISSDGHLAITQQVFESLRGHARPEDENYFFVVMVHLGTLTALVIRYRAEVHAGARGLLGSTDVPPAFRRSKMVRVGLLVTVATLPLIPLAFLIHKIEAAFHSPTITGLGFLVTAAVLAMTARLRGGEKGPEETTRLAALLVGIAQMFAPLPGVSRSGLTIATALGLGFSRTWAVGFSLLLAVPAILGGAILELRKVDPATLTADRVGQTVAATVLAGLVGYAAIVWLVRIVRSGRLWYFSVYLVAMAAFVLVVLARPGDRPDARHEGSVDGTARSGSARPGLEAGADRVQGPLDRPDAPGARPGGP